MLEARGEERIVGRRERKLIDHDQGQRFALHVHAFPETLAAEEYGVPDPAEARQQFAARALALHEQRVVEPFARERGGERLSSVRQRPQRREEQERATAARLE